MILAEICSRGSDPSSYFRIDGASFILRLSKTLSPRVMTLVSKYPETVLMKAKNDRLQLEL